MAHYIFSTTSNALLYFYFHVTTNVFSSQKMILNYYLQIIKYVWNGSYSESINNYLGIDTVAIWKLRFLNLLIPFIQTAVVLALNIRPPMFHHLTQFYPISSRSKLDQYFFATLLVSLTIFSWKIISKWCSFLVL